VGFDLRALSPHHPFFLASFVTDTTAAGAATVALTFSLSG